MKKSITYSHFTRFLFLFFRVYMILCTIAATVFFFYLLFCFLSNSISSDIGKPDNSVVIFEFKLPIYGDKDGKIKKLIESERAEKLNDNIMSLNNATIKEYDLEGNVISTKTIDHALLKINNGTIEIGPSNQEDFADRQEGVGKP